MRSYDEQFDELYRVAYRLAYRMLGRREDADDIAQEALGRALLEWRKVQSFPDASPWVARVAANLVIGRWRRGRPPSPPTLPPERTSDHAELRLDLYRALLRLPRRQRETVVLRYLADFSERTVAEVLGCSPGTVKQHAARGLTALRAHLRDSYDDEVKPDVRGA